MCKRMSKIVAMLVVVAVVLSSIGATAVAAGPEKQVRSAQKFGDADEGFGEASDDGLGEASDDDFGEASDDSGGMWDGILDEDPAVAPRPTLAPYDPDNPDAPVVPDYIPDSDDATSDDVEFDEALTAMEEEMDAIASREFTKALKPELKKQLKGKMKEVPSISKRAWKAKVRKQVLPVTKKNVKKTVSKSMKKSMKKKYGKKLGSWFDQMYSEQFGQVFYEHFTPAFNKEFEKQFNARYKQLKK